MALKVAEKKANFINATDPTEISTMAKIASGLDFSRPIEMVSKILEDKTLKDQELDILRLRSQIDRSSDAYQKLFANKTLYKNDEQYKETVGKFEGEFNSLGSAIDNANLTTAQQVKLREYQKTAMGSISNFANYNVTLEKFDQQQSEINAMIQDGAYAVQSASLMGTDGLTIMDQRMATLNEIISGQVEKKLITRDAASQMIAGILAQGTVTAHIVTETNNIMNSKGDYLTKIEKLTKLKDNYRDKDFIKHLSEKTSEGESNTNADTIEVEMNNNMEKYLGIVNQKIATVNTQHQIQQAREAEARAKKEKELDYFQTEQFNRLRPVNPYEAERLKAQILGKNPNFETPVSYFSDKNIQIENYGKNFNLADRNDTTIINMVSQNGRAMLYDLMNNPSKYIDLSQFTSDRQVMKAVLGVGMDIVAAEIGTDDKVVVAKAIVGVGLQHPVFAPNGVDLEAALIINGAGSERVGADEDRYLDRIISYQDGQTILDTVYIGDIPITEKARVSAIEQAVGQDIFLPQTLVDGKGWKMYKTAYFTENDYFPDGKYVKITRTVVPEIATTKNPDLTKTQTRAIGDDVLNYLRTDIGQKEVQAIALARYKAENPKYLSETGGIVKGVSEKQLNTPYNKNGTTTTAMKEALKEITESIMADQGLINRQTPYSTRINILNVTTANKALNQ